MGRYSPTATHARCNLPPGVAVNVHAPPFRGVTIPGPALQPSSSPTRGLMINPNSQTYRGSSYCTQAEANHAFPLLPPPPCAPQHLPGRRDGVTFLLWTFSSLACSRPSLEVWKTIIARLASSKGSHGHYGDDPMQTSTRPDLHAATDAEKGSGIHVFREDQPALSLLEKYPSPYLFQDDGLGADGRHWFSCRRAQDNTWRREAIISGTLFPPLLQIDPILPVHRQVLAGTY